VIPDSLERDVDAAEMADDAVTLFHWAVTEHAKGRHILSSSAGFTDVSRLAMPCLDRVRSA